MMLPEERKIQQLNLGRLVRLARTRGGHGTRFELAEKADCTEQDVASLENGDATCDLSTIKRICRAVGLSDDASLIYEIL